MTYYPSGPFDGSQFDKYNQPSQVNKTSNSYTLTSVPQVNGVWVAYTNHPSLFETDPPVVMFSTELEALRFAVKDTSRVVKVVFVPFNRSLFEYLK